MQMEKVKYINLKDKPNYIDETYLTHWTGRDKTKEQAFSILEIIVKTCKLKLTSHPVNPKKSFLVNMICFTDIPLDESKIHCSKYGYFGISFNKKELIEYGANPVLYLMNQRSTQQDFLINESLPKTPNQIDFKKIINLNWFVATCQPYNMKPNENDYIPEYYEREWRIASRFDNYSNYNFKGEIINEQPEGKKGESFLTFDRKIIEKIIVPEEYKEVVDKLRKDNNVDCEIILLKHF